MATQTLAPRRPAPSHPARPRRLARARAWLRSRLRPRMVLILVAALVVTVLGAGELAAMLRARSAPLATDTISLGGLTIQIDSVTWVPFDTGDPTILDPSTAGGYQMPAQMMPGMPADGQGRLNIQVTLSDPGGSARTLNTAGEFRLGGGGKGDAGWKLQGDTFGGLKRVNPGNAVDGKLFFDLQPPTKQDPPLYLRWRRGGDTARLLLVPGGTAATHHHH